MEKIKGMRGSEEHPELVRKWLKEQGAVDFDGWNCTRTDIVYFVSERNVVKALNAYDCEFLFDIVNLHKPKLKVVRGSMYRGKAVIDLLESMGGKNIYCLTGVGDSFYYYIDNEYCNIIKNVYVGSSFLNKYELEELTLPEEKPVLKVIKGDEERCEEIIALLESMGGTNPICYQGAYNKNYYYIDKNNVIYARSIENDFFNDYKLEIIELPKKEYAFKPFDKVLIRDRNDEKWMPSFFSCKVEDDILPFKMMGGGSYKQCIPYEGHENLIFKCE